MELLLMRLSLLMLASCGALKVVPEPILPPNVADACKRAISCEVFAFEQTPECERCVEKLAELYDEKQHGKIPPLDQVPCDVVAKYAHDTLVSECVVRRSFGP